MPETNHPIFLESLLDLLPFQTEFLKRGLMARGVDTSVLSGPRGLGKSSLAAAMLTSAMTPGTELWIQGAESVLLGSNMEQARICFRFVREWLEAGENPGDYRYQDAATRIGITHKPSGSRLRVISSSGRGAMGLGARTNIAVLDEPGAFHEAGGTLMWNALSGALGKPGSRMRLIAIGTLAPGGVPGSWWGNLVDGGSQPGRYVQLLQSDPDRWDDFDEVRRVNPLTAISDQFTRKLKIELAEAKRDSRRAAYFKSYKCNLPSRDVRTMLLTTADWDLVKARPVPERKGRPMVGVDLGSGRAWSAAVALWPATGRVEALACAPGIPSIGEQERRDGCPSGLYRSLVESGQLRICEGLRVQPPEELIAAIRAAWGAPRVLIADRFKLDALQDCAGRTQVIPRKSRWSEATEDVEALRAMCKDGPLGVPEESRGLLEASLSVSVVATDDQGGTRLQKDFNSRARDDIAAALLLVAGLWKRSRSGRSKRRIRTAVA